MLDEESTQFERKLLLGAFACALAAVDGRASVANALRRRDDFSPTHIVAIGKAASAMLLGALDVPTITPRQILLVTKCGHVDPQFSNRSDIVVIEAGHPLPDEMSIAAGRRLLQMIDEASADDVFLFLLSGGTSSLVEVPIPGLSLDPLRAINQQLLASGLDIHHVNAIRKCCSQIKGGRLLRMLGSRRAEVMLISDVPGDNVADIGSGLLCAADSYVDFAVLLPTVRRLIADYEQSIVHSSLPIVPHTIVANLADAREAAANFALARQLPVFNSAEFIAGEASAVGESLARHVLDGAPGFYIFGGETTVTLPPNPGRGGRNQTAALAAARVLAGRDDVFFLAAGTDGTDGPGDDAGALVDGGTLSRGEEAGFDSENCLRCADAGTFLEASGDLIQTGPTGTNVMDLVLAYKTDTRVGNV